MGLIVAFSWNCRLLNKCPQRPLGHRAECPMHWREVGDKAQLITSGEWVTFLQNSTCFAFSGYANLFHSRVPPDPLA